MGQLTPGSSPLGEMLANLAYQVNLSHMYALLCWQWIWKFFLNCDFVPVVKLITIIISNCVIELNIGLIWHILMIQLWSDLNYDSGCMLFELSICVTWIHTYIIINSFYQNLVLLHNVTYILLVVQTIDR